MGGCFDNFLALFKENLETWRNWAHGQVPEDGELPQPFGN